MNKKDLRSLSLDELKNAAEDCGEKTYRGSQVYEWLHKRCADGLDEMTNVPKSFRNRISEDYELYDLEVIKVLRDEEDGTCKFLLKTVDDNVIESVLMKYEHGFSACISSQVGCRMGCSFCASTIGGRIRDLTAGEMAEQIYAMQKSENVRISNIVVMGTGEPFDNYDSFVRFYEIITGKEGQNISGRNITVSTCGIVEKIRELADRHFALTLAISLHAPYDELRKKIMPVANRYSIEEIMDACDYFFERTGRRVTFEYSLISEVNDSRECAERLAKLLKGKNSHVNLIPVNPVKERDYKRSGQENISAFKKLLEKNGINVTIRRGMGKNIDAACGQLRRSYIKGEL
ncbi:MAG: 23S rRNA (adenine(2503)-C(2))-methyltransferase RlmN [Lachnospiraceae bacterium]|nr:23S rRNA (adenine(2503)-C(2))-methyltransferase RlmN [Lachnospiraceae bacterium]